MPARPATLSTIALALTITALAAEAGFAQAPVASFKTPGCEGASTWRIGYRMYFVNRVGTRLERDDRTGRAIQAAQQFTELVGSYSRCGMRVSVDVYDMGETVFDGCGQTDCPAQRMGPSDGDSFANSHRYDGVFYRYPRLSDDEFFGRTAPGGFRWYEAFFPVPPGDDDSGFGAPWRQLILHEWLHNVVWHVSAARWPRGRSRDPVHAGCEIEPYKSDPDEPCMVSGRYFRDLMRRRVRERGAWRGITRAEWRRCGTPRKPRNRRRCTATRRLG